MTSWLWQSHGNSPSFPSTSTQLVQEVSHPWKYSAAGRGVGGPSSLPALAQLLAQISNALHSLEQRSRGAARAKVTAAGEGLCGPRTAPESWLPTQCPMKGESDRSTCLKRYLPLSLCADVYPQCFYSVPLYRTQITSFRTA